MNTFVHEVVCVEGVDARNVLQCRRETGIGELKNVFDEAIRAVCESIAIG